MRPITAVSLLVASVVATACARQPAGDVPAPRAAATADIPTAVRGGIIITKRVDSIPPGAPRIPRMGDPSTAELATMALVVAGLLPAPNVLIIAVGDTLNIHDALNVTAFDSTGTYIDALTNYDLHMTPAAAVLTFRNAPAIVGKRVGNALLWLSFPSRAWGARSGTPPRVGIPVFVIERPPR